MLALLRRSRATALAMVLLVPGITGSAVQWLHACPADAQAAADHQHDNSHSSDQGHSQGCECLGSCNTTGAIAPARAFATLPVVAVPEGDLTPPAEISFVSSGTPSDLLPPATAPPLG